MNLDCFRYGVHQEPVYYRKGTSDEAVIHSILGGTEYNFPMLESPKVILDCGGNIGVAAVLMSTLYPNATIYSCEPVKANFDILVKNVQRFPNVKAFNFGIGKYTEELSIYESDDPTNHGGFSFYDKGVNKNKHQVVTLKNAQEFLEFEEKIDGIDLIKIDTEGAEFDILTTIPKNILMKTRFILGELHGTKDFQLLAYLEDNGFSVGVQKAMHCRISKFQAERMIK